MSSIACPSCGALNAASAAPCVLCGTDLHAPVPADDPSGPEIPAGEVSAGAPGALCPSCGHANPAGAAFCNRCGTALARMQGLDDDEEDEDAPRLPPEAGTSPAARPSSAPGRRAVGFIAGGLALVALLYGATLISSRAPEPAPSASEAPAPGAAIPDGPAPPLADARQQTLADSLGGLGTAEGHFEAGRIYLTAGFDAQQSGDAAGVLWVRESIAAFERSLELDDRADTRFALAEAAQFDPSDPMRPTVEAQQLLARDPDHVGGNFLMGQLRMTIGRVDSARVSFERVLALTTPADPFFGRAQEMIGVLEAAATAPQGPAQAPAP